MSKTIKEEKLRWVLLIYNKEIKFVDAAKVCPYSKRTLERWVSPYRKYGEKGLNPKSTEPKTQPNEIPVWIKEGTITIRKQTKKYALKIFKEIGKEGISIKSRVIGKILRKEGLTRKYRVKRIKYRYIRSKMKTEELAEIDVKYVSGIAQN